MTDREFLEALADDLEGIIRTISTKYNKTEFEKGELEGYSQLWVRIKSALIE